MKSWRILALDHGKKVGQTWMSRVYDNLDDALAWAAWMQQRDRLFGYENPFTVVEVQA